MNTTTELPAELQSRQNTIDSDKTKALNDLYQANQAQMNLDRDIRNYYNSQPK